MSVWNILHSILSLRYCGSFPDRFWMTFQNNISVTGYVYEWRSQTKDRLKAMQRLLTGHKYFSLTGLAIHRTYHKPYCNHTAIEKNEKNKMDPFEFNTNSENDSDPARKVRAFNILSHSHISKLNTNSYGNKTYGMTYLNHNHQRHGCIYWKQRKSA